MPSGHAEDDAFNPVSMSQLLVHVPVSSYFLAAAAAEVDLFADIGIEARNVYEEGVRENQKKLYNMYFLYMRIISYRKGIYLGEMNLYSVR